MAETALRRLEKLRTDFGRDRAARKLDLLAQLARAPLRNASRVRRLHDVLCFMRAYPDDGAVLTRVERLLAGFDRRADFRAVRDELAYSGIAGTSAWFPYFYPTACWLAARWPAQLTLDRTDGVAQDALDRVLPLLLSPAQAEAVRSWNVPSFTALDRLRPRRQTDAVFLLQVINRMPGTAALREALYDAINPSCELAPGRDTPSRTHAKYAAAPVVYQTSPLRGGRPDLAAEIRRAPRAMRRLTRGAAESIIELARAALATRARDLDAFAYGDARNAWWLQHEGGLAHAFVGIVPARRAPLATTYGFLTLQNGVPIGYGQIDVLGHAAALAFNTFESFRGGEAAYSYARLAASVHAFFGATSFSADSYQLGKDNDEAIASGAWWFYYKLGFRPRAAPARALLQAERARMRRRAGYRSPPATLARLAQWPLFFELPGTRSQPLPAALISRRARRA